MCWEFEGISLKPLKHAKKRGWLVESQQLMLSAEEIQYINFEVVILSLSAVCLALLESKAIACVPVAEGGRVAVSAA